MKSTFFKTGILTFLAVSFLFTSCNKDEDQITETSADLTMEQSKQAAETDVVTLGVFSVIETAYAEQEGENGRVSSLFSDCVIITISSENDITFITLDFGLGCELNNGNIVSGKINITYGPLQGVTRTINYSFENFIFNSKGVAGGGTIFREHSNALGNPQSTLNKDLEITFPSGLIALANGTRVIEWIEGVGSGTWTDNVHLVTGNWTIVFSTGFSKSRLVTEALRHEATCPSFVSGMFDITRNENIGTLNFGDGTCDNIAILTVNGVEHIIRLH